MRSCFLLGKDIGGGGNTMDNFRNIVVRRNAAVGDCIASSIVADKLNEQGYSVTWQSHSDMHCIMRRQPSIARVQLTGGQCHVDLDGAYEQDPSRRVRHFSDMFLSKANQQLLRMGIQLGKTINCRPRLRLTQVERGQAQEKFKQYPRPWVFCNPRSDSFIVRQVPDGVWAAAAPKIAGTKFWMGRHPAPPGFVDLHLQHLDNLIVWLSAADLLITVDTGPLHVGAALGVPILALGQSSSPELHLSDQVDFQTIEPGQLRCLNCQANVCPISHFHPPCQDFDPEFIALWANAKLRQRTTETVSAVVAIWKPEASVLNRCLAALLPQVQEIIVTSERNSIVPANAMRDPKIRYVSTWRQNIGYSGNANFGARHSTGKYLLLCNDDAFLAPNAVERMMDVMKPGIGIVSNLLRYSDGTIYYAGKTRSPGVRGWSHQDHRQRNCTFQTVTEIENACGCCILVRREAFYQANALDEELALFSQDDALSLTVRSHGWKILFTPHSEGVHMEHQSVNKVGDIMTLVGAANAGFDRKFGAYLTHNANRIPGNFDYLKA